MNEPIKEYNSIKKLVENNDIENMANKNSKNDLKLIAHQKKQGIVKTSRIDKYLSKKNIYNKIYIDNGQYRK